MKLEALYVGYYRLYLPLWMIRLQNADFMCGGYKSIYVKSWKTRHKVSY